ncbi:GNAT family N-acetyltransferase [Frateuria defendens]|uniref:GNAT family N-acetyltransferase n=1 Tax=Frateuria defendens TaxID=2219559 RepID=UPI00069D93B6|nr:GNAT family N-acetyltransferase [Frateuria defendens]
MSGLSALAFPPARTALLSGPAGLGVELRPAQDGDLPFLRTLYGELRTAELAAVPWPEAARQAFLDNQFALQHRHYTTHYLPADFLVIEHSGHPIGRLYVHRGEREAVLVDIALRPAWRGRGIGRRLIGLVQAATRQAGLAALALHVELGNAAAQRLYERLGFVAGEVAGHHRAMRWDVARDRAVS